MDEAAKKATLRMIPYGLYLVGVRRKDVKDPATDINAFMGSWVTQASFKPPMVVACVRRDVHSNAMIKESGVFTLNILGSGQRDLGVTFFKTLDVKLEEGADEGMMSGVPFKLEENTKCPVFPDLPAWIACEVVHHYDGDNDHTVFVARIVEASHDGRHEPLTHEETGWSYAG